VVIEKSSHTSEKKETKHIANRGEGVMAKSAGIKFGDQVCKAIEMEAGWHFGKLRGRGSVMEGNRGTILERSLRGGKFRKEKPKNEGGRDLLPASRKGQSSRNIAKQEYEQSN